MYVDNKNEVVPFWENHLQKETVYPFELEYITSFLRKVNKNIEVRGSELCEKKPTNL